MELRYLNPKHRRSPRNLTVDDIWEDQELSETSGPFRVIKTFYSEVLPWLKFPDVDGIDYAYLQHSANKFVAPWVYRFLTDEGRITLNGERFLADAVNARYFKKWQHLWDLYTAEYSPLNTYEMSETLTIEHEGEDSYSSNRTPNLTTRALTDEGITNEGDNSSTTTYGKDETATHGGSSRTVDSRKGFNSSNFVDSEQTTTTPQTTDTTVQSGSDTIRDLVDESTTRNSDTTTTQTGTEATASSGSNSYIDTHTKTREGNMYRSPADLMKEDREFWHDEYFSIVFADMDEFLTLAIYSEAPINNKVF